MFLLAFAESIQLFPDGTLVIHIALILIMIGVLNRTFFKPINRVLTSRDKHKFGPGGQAGQIMSEAEEKEALLNAEMLSARGEGYELVDKERTAAMERRAKLIADAKAEAASALDKQRDELKRQTEAARATIAEEAREMADKIAANVLRA